MECKEAQACISRDIDGELPEQERQVLAEHLSRCAECSRFAERCRRLQGLMDRASVPMPEDAYWDELWDRVTEEQASHQERWHTARRSFYRVVSAVAVAACVLLAVGTIVQQSRIGRMRAEIETLRAASPGAGTTPWDLESVARLVAPAQGEVLAEQAAAFHLVNDYFSGGLQWMVQDGAQSELGLGGPVESAASWTEPEAMTVEIRLLRTQNGQGGSVLSAPTLMIRPGAEANFALAASNTRGAKRFRYRCAAGKGADGGARLAVEVSLCPLAGGEPVKLCGVVAPEEGRAVPVALSHVEDVEYVLLVWTGPGKARARSLTQT